MLAIAVSIALVLIKFVLAYFSGSLALKADAWHSTADALISVLVWFGIVISRSGRRWAVYFENIIALVISGLIFGAAWLLVRENLARSPEEQIRLIPVALVGLAFCAMVSRWIGHYQIKVGHEEDSIGMLADGHHSLIDFFTTIVAIVGLLGQMIGLRLDSIASIVVVLFVVEVGIEIAVLAIRNLIRKQATFSHKHGERGLIFRALHGMAQLVPFVVTRLTGKKATLTSVSRWVADHAKRLATAALLIVLAAYFVTGFYKVGPQSVGMATVFGKYTGSPQGPGMHYNPPYPIGKVRLLDTGAVQRIELGYRTNPEKSRDWQKFGLAPFEWHSAHTSGYYTKEYNEAIFLTGDENLIDINAVIHFRIADPRKYLFSIDNKDLLLRSNAQEVLRTIIGVTPIDKVLTADRREIQQQATEMLHANMAKNESGIDVLAIELQDVHPPVSVVRAFRDVATAKEEKSLAINEALGDANEKIPEARAEAVSSVRNAEGYRQSKIQEAKGQTSRFLSLQAQYKPAPQVTSVRLFLEAMEKSLPGRRKFIISPDMGKDAFELRFLPVAGGGSKNKGKQE